MHVREQIAELVEKIIPLDDIERVHQCYIRDWIASGAELFRVEKPARPEPHLVVYFVPFDENEKRIFLVHHKKADLWLPPGGHVEKDEHPKDTVIREMQEELMSEAVFHSKVPLFLTVTKTVNDAHSHTDVTLWYVLKGDSNKKYEFASEEFHAVSWVGVDDASSEKATDPHFKRFLFKLKMIQNETSLNF